MWNKLEKGETVRLSDAIRVGHLNQKPVRFSAWPWCLDRHVACPDTSHPTPTILPIFMIIMGLKKEHGWLDEDIAAWVAMIERKENG